MMIRACALAAMVAALGSAACAQTGDGPVPAMTSPPTIYSSTPPSAAVRATGPALPRISAGPGANSGAPQTGSPSPARITIDAREERRFLRDAAARSRFELDASKLTFAKSGNSAVRALAASVINHQNTASVELAHLLNARGMALPMIGNEQRKALNQLNKLNGNRLDAAYLQQVGLAQAAMSREYEKANNAIREPRINAWIAKTIPTLRYHQTLAERAAPPDSEVARWNRGGQRPQAAPAGTAGVQPIVDRGSRSQRVE